MSLSIIFRIYISYFSFAFKVISCPTLSSLQGLC